MKKYWIWKGLKFIAFAAIIVSALGMIVMHLWNWLLPELIGASAISFTQSIALLLLAKILFGGLFRGGRRHHRMHWKYRMQEKMKSMSPEEQKNFQLRFRSCCGHHWTKSETIASPASSQ